MLKKIHAWFHRHYHTRYYGVYRNAKQLFVFDLLLLGIGITMLSATLFFFFWKPGVADQIELLISLGDGRIKSGELVHLTVDYTNRSKVQIQNPTLAVRLPPGFVVDRSSTPENVFSKNDTFSLPALTPGSHGQAVVTGRFWAEPGHDERFLATLSYTQEKNDRPEQAFGSFLATLPESVLDGTITTATTTLPRQSFLWRYAIANTSDAPVTGINLTLAHNTDVAMTVTTGTLRNLQLLPGETKTIAGQATALTAVPNVVVAVTSALVANNYSINQGVSAQKVLVFSPHMHAETAFADPPTFVEPGQKVPVLVTWKNDGDFDLEQLRLVFTPTPGTIDLATTARENNIKIVGDSLVADRSNRTALADGRKNSADTFTILLTFLPRFSVPFGITAFTFLPTMHAALPSVSQQTFSINGNSTAAIPLATELTLTSETRYYTPEGDQLGRGPLPPMVGETTKYWILVQLNNTTNPVNHAHFETTLPPQITFTDRQSVTIGQPIQYDKNTRKVSWDYRLLPANSQTGLYFEVAVTPTPELVGKAVPLTGPLIFTAVDDVVGKSFSLLHNALTNVLSLDDRGARKGATVIAPP